MRLVRWGICPRDGSSGKPKSLPGTPYEIFRVRFNIRVLQMLQNSSSETLSLNCSFVQRNFHEQLRRIPQAAILLGALGKANNKGAKAISKSSVTAVDIGHWPPQDPRGECCGHRERPRWPSKEAIAVGGSHRRRRCGRGSPRGDAADHCCRIRFLRRIHLSPQCCCGRSAAQHRPVAAGQESTAAAARCRC